MNASTGLLSSALRGFVCVAVAWIGLATALGAFGAATGADDTSDKSAILRLDPIKHKLFAVGASELKAGCIYSHFDEKSNRRVWSFWQSDGRFWHALGEGTTQPARSLDLRGSRESNLEILEQVDREFAQKVERSGGLAFLRLNHENQWELDRVATIPTIYNAETGDRWDWTNGRYVPVVSSSGYRWAVSERQYVPVEESASQGEYAGPVPAARMMENRPCACGGRR